MKHVLILGGGVAGLSAARTLTQAGVDVTLLEARSQLGGRVRTEAHQDQFATELGAEFVHGQPREIFELIEADGIEVQEVKGQRVRIVNDEVVESPRFLDEVDALLSKISLDGPDRSIVQLLDDISPREELRRRVMSYVGGFHAADPGKVSAQSLARNELTSEAVHAEHSYVLPGGYAHVVGALSRRIDGRYARIVLDAEVDRVEWRRGHVEVYAGKKVYSGDAVIVALPLGVLLANRVRFTPPVWARGAALHRQTMGKVLRFTVRFREPVWHESPREELRHDFSFLFTDDEQIPTWWRRGEHGIVGWSAGVHSERLPTLELARRDVVLQKLAQHFRVPLARVTELCEEIACHDWQADPLFRGAYSYALVGGETAPITLSTPLEHTLVFAGEHCDTSSQTGTVHGAIASGRHAAVALL